MKTNVKRYPYLMIAGIVACLHFFGCAGDFRGTSIPKPDQDDAIRVAWNEALGQTAPFTYEILFIEERDPGCAGWFDEWNHVCVVGLTEHHAGIVQLLWLPGMKWSESAFAHEVTHIYGCATGNCDPDHNTPLFCNPGQIAPCDGGFEDGGTVVVVKSALKAWEDAK